jgi:hypothetical protein
MSHIIVSVDAFIGNAHDLGLDRTPSEFLALPKPYSSFHDRCMTIWEAALRCACVPTVRTSRFESRFGAQRNDLRIVRDSDCGPCYTGFIMIGPLASRLGPIFFVRR